MNKVLITLCTVVSTTLSLQLDAAEAKPSYDIVYTPNRIAEDKSETLANITVISQEEIEQKQYQSLEEVLNSLPGINIAQSGGKGTVSSIFYRGTNSNHTIVLVDGVRLVSVNGGAPNLSIIPVSMIERVEAVSGANSSIYGADAIGGVIQIFTKKGQAGKTLSSLEIGGGSNNTKHSNANISANSKNNNAWISVNTAFEESNSFDATSTGAEPDDDTYRNKAISINTGIKFADNKAKLTVNLLSSSDDVYYDANNAKAEARQQNIATTLDYQLFDKLDITASYAQSQDKSRNYHNGAFNSSFNSKYKKSSLIANYRLSENTRFTLGGDLIHEKADTSNNYSNDARHSKAAFVLIRHKLNNTTFEGSYRLEDSSQYHTNETGGLAISQDIGNMKVTASHKKAFHAPTFNNLYGTFGANPNLNPETSDSTEINFQGKYKNITNNLSFYRTRIEDLITYGSAPLFTQRNTAKARTKGIDFSSAVDLGDTQLGLRISSLSAKDKTTGDDLLRRPKLKGSFSASHKINKLLLGAEIHSQSYSKEFSGSNGGFTTFDATARYQLTPRLQIGARGINLSNKQYETAKGFNQPDREYHVYFKYTGSH